MARRILELRLVMVLVYFTFIKMGINDTMVQAEFLPLKSIRAGGPFNGLVLRLVTVRD